MRRVLLVGILCGLVGALLWGRRDWARARRRSPVERRPPLDEMTVEQLRRVARDLEIAGRSTMRKQELIDAIDAIR